MINRYLGIFFIVAPILGTKSIPAGAGNLRGVRRPNSTRIIIRHAPRLQGATCTGLSQPERKFSNVANGHHFQCRLGGDLQRDRLGDGRNRWRPTNQCVKFVLKGAFGHYSCFKFASRPLRLRLTRQKLHLIDAEIWFRPPGPTLYRLA